MAQEVKEQVERIFFEHISFLYKSIFIACVVFLLAIAVAIVVKLWWVVLAGLLGLIPVYFAKKKRNRFIITNKRFIRELYNPHHSIIAVPLADIVNVKILNRATDKHGGVQIQTTPAYGEQLLVDGENEYGIIVCRKIPDHANFRDILAFAAEAAATES